MYGTNDHDQVLDASAHYLSHALMSHSAPVTCSTLAWVVVLFVLQVNTVFVVYWVNTVFMWSKLLVFSIRYTTGVLKCGRWMLYALGSIQAGLRADMWSIQSVKHQWHCQSTRYFYLSLSLSVPPAFVLVSIEMITIWNKNFYFVYCVKVKLYYLRNCSSHQILV